MNDSIITLIDAGVCVDAIDAAGSWRTAKRAAAALTALRRGSDGLSGDAYLLSVAEQWLIVGLRTGWVARHMLHREVGLDDVKGWLAVVPQRMSVDVLLMLADAMRSKQRQVRVAATVVLREWMSIPQRSHHPKQLAFTILLTRRCLTLAPPPGIGEAEWFPAAYLATTLGGSSGRPSTHLRLDDDERRWVVDRCWRDRTARATVSR